MSASQPEGPSGLWRLFVNNLVTSIQAGLDEEGIPTEAALDGVFAKLEVGAGALGKGPLWIIKVYRRLLAVLHRRAGE